MITKRNVSLDMVSGILIILLIFYHAAQWGKLTETSTYQNAMHIFFFVMPWFYFKSGFVHNKTYSFRKMIAVSVAPIFFILIIGTLIGYTLTLPGLILSGASITTIILKPIILLLKYGMALGNPPLWFLLSLIFVKIILNFVVKLNYKLIVLLILTLVSIGWVQNYYFSELEIGAHKALPLGLSFALLGYLYRHKEIVERTKQFKILVFLMTIASSVLFTSYIHVHFNELRTGYYWVYFINCVLAISSLLFIFRKIVWKPLIWVGERTVIFFVMHWPLFYVINHICRFVGIPQKGWVFMVILSFFATLGSIIIAKYLPIRYIATASSKIVALSKTSR